MYGAKLILRAVLTASEYSVLEHYFALFGEANFEGCWHLTGILKPTYLYRIELKLMQKLTPYRPQKQSYSLFAIPGIRPSS